MLEQAVQNTFFNAAQSMQIAAMEWQRPFVTLRPRVFPDGNAWCALYGDDLQSGVAGFGDTPAAAAADFDLQWSTQKAPAARGVNPSDGAQRKEGGCGS